MMCCRSSQLALLTAMLPCRGSVFMLMISRFSRMEREDLYVEALFESEERFDQNQRSATYVRFLLDKNTAKGDLHIVNTCLIQIKKCRRLKSVRRTLPPYVPQQTTSYEVLSSSEFCPEVRGAHPKPTSCAPFVTGGSCLQIVTSMVQSPIVSTDACGLLPPSASSTVYRP